MHLGARSLGHGVVTPRLAMTWGGLDGFGGFFQPPRPQEDVRVKSRGLFRSGGPHDAANLFVDILPGFSKWFSNEPTGVLPRYAL